MTLLNKKKTLPRALVWWALIATLSGAPLAGGGGPGPSAAQAAPDEVVATLQYRGQNPTRQLVLIRKSLPRLDPLEYLRAPAEAARAGSLAFLVVDAAVGELARGKVVGLVYANEDTAIRPRELWSAGLAWRDDGPLAYLVVTRSMSWHVTLSLYEIDPPREVAAYPLAFEARRYREWPHADEPISKAERTILGQNPCGVASIEVIYAGEELWIRGKRPDEDCPAAVVRFNTRTREWSEWE